MRNEMSSSHANKSDLCLNFIQLSDQNKYQNKLYISSSHA
jgi:hypothetical protein